MIDYRIVFVGCLGLVLNIGVSLAQTTGYQGVTKPTKTVVEQPVTRPVVTTTKTGTTDTRTSTTTTTTSTSSSSTSTTTQSTNTTSTTTNTPSKSPRTTTPVTTNTTTSVSTVNQQDAVVDSTNPTPVDQTLVDPRVNESTTTTDSTTTDSTITTVTDILLPDDTNIADVATQQMISARMNGGMSGEVPTQIWKAMTKQDRVAMRMTQKQLTGAQLVMMAKVVAPISTMHQAMANTEGILLNSLLALLYLLVFFYCTQLINELRDRIKDDWGLGSSLLQHSFDRLQEYLIIRILIVVFGLILLGILMSFIDTSHLVVGSESIWLTIFLLGTLVLGALAKDIALYLIVLVKSGRGVSLNISVAGYVPAVISVVLNRLVALTPNVLFGSVIKVKSDTLADSLVNSPAHRTWSLSLVMIVAIVLRLVSDGFVGGWYVFCIGLAYGLCVDVFWALTRVDAFWGPDVYRYNKWVRFVLYFTVLFAFLHLVFNPAGDFDQVQTALSNDFWSMIWILVRLIVMSGCFWMYVYYLHPVMFRKTE